MTEIVTKTPAADTSSAAAPIFSKGYQRGAILVLMLIYVFNFVDRQVVNILAESIKTDLHLSDAQLGAISGLAFALFYSVLGLPIARLAERGDRPRILAASVGLWSLFTVLSGLANNFLHLALARLGVGIGEAGGVPPAHSLITEFTPASRRASALALYSVGLPLGSLVGLALGGLIADAWGWRIAFFVAGAPGLALAVASLFVLKEPRRALSAKAAAATAEAVSLRQTFGLLARKPTFRFAVLGAATQAFVAYGVASFMAPFFLRTHAVELEAVAAQFSLGATGFLGISLGLTSGLAAAVGTGLGGVAADRFRADKTGYVIVPAICSLLCAPCYVGVFLSPSIILSLALLALGSALSSAWYGPIHATSQSIVAPRMRATVSAVSLVIVNLIGLGLGPLFVGVVSDVATSAGLTGAGAGLRLALAVTSLFGLLAAALFWRARRTLVADLAS